ncbi:MAG: RagB/SusD family nutrient uptake outer membrane protein [Chitinophagaceae bacterium]|nr:RagB/SusD family nutrient uptake outer membrane protein [Chitinophagaceae bacterium]
MNKYIKNMLMAGGIAATLAGCNPLNLDTFQDPNNPSVGSVTNNASRAQIQFLITGLEARHRGYVFTATAGFGTFGREIWYLNASDPRWQTDWLGQGGRVPDAAYFGFGAAGGTVYSGAYQAIRQAYVLRDAALNTNQLTDTEKKAITGFAKTIAAYQFMLPAMFQYENGIRVDVENPLRPGDYVSLTEAMTFMNNLLNEGLNDLNGAGTEFPAGMRLTAGWTGFTNIDGLKRVNRAIAARLAVYRKDWQGALTALNASFMNTSATTLAQLAAGPAHTYGGPPDVFNPLFFVLNANVSTMIVVHPSVLRDTTAGDLRVRSKFFARTSPVTVSSDAGSLSGTHQDNRWPANTSFIPFIKNEELILIKAEAHANLNQSADAVAAINIIRNAAGIGNYGGATTTSALINEVLYQRRYSLWAEPWGHRWIDTRRYDRLNDIDVSFDGGTRFRQFPRPQSDINWDLYING